MQISYKELAERAGISESYATQVLGNKRGASLSMAFKIYDATGLQFGILEGLGADTIEHLRPKSQDKAA